MNNEELTKELREQRILIEKIFISVEKTRKYFLWTMIATIVTFVLPLVAILFMIPYLMSSVSTLLTGTNLGL